MADGRASGDAAGRASGDAAGRASGDAAGRGSGDAALERFRTWRRSGDRSVRNALIEEHSWLAQHCARRFSQRGEPLDDLIQVAQLGLLKAVERFDPEIGVSFPAFAMPTVVGELRRHFRDATWTVKVPRRVKDLHLELNAALEGLGGELGRPPRPDELAAVLGVDVEEVLEALDARGAYRPSSLGPVASEGSDDPRLATDDEILAGAEDRLVLDRLLATLEPRERQIVELRHFHGLSQSEIAERVGVSQVHVSRLLRSSLNALRDAAGDKH